MTKQWSDMYREDLQIIPKMEALGFKPDFHSLGVLYKRITPEDVPFFNVSFMKGNLHIWKIKKGWQTALIKDGSFTGHRPFDSIEDLITHLVNTTEDRAV